MVNKKVNNVGRFPKNKIEMQAANPNYFNVYY